ncbi:MAG: HD-GYP domain-containing protein [Clostridium sp.]|uniref:HD-GYP domain-containing protein n=1 Tax=Clostridium sp. TaxID=1506 RepID=UPI003021CCF7
MRLEYINTVKEDDVLAKHVYGEDGRILLKAGVKLNSVYIKRLNELSVYCVYLEDDRLDDIEVEDEKLTVVKQETMKSLKNISRGITCISGKVGDEYLNNIDQLVELIMEVGDVNKCLCDIRTHDNYTFLHSINTGIMSVFFGINLGMKKWAISELGISGMLHDVGKLKVPAAIINKGGKLTEEEFTVVKQHPIYGGDILKKNFRISCDAIAGVEQHHEKIDGRGYPYGLKGNQISRFGKIVGICDVYDAVTSNRSYRNKFEPNEAYELILSGCGTQFDEDLVRIFKDTFAVYALGSCVKLSNGVEGYIIKQNRGFPDRPIIRVLYDHLTREPVRFYEINLLEKINLTVQSVI